MQQLIKACWAGDAVKRPDFVHIVANFDARFFAFKFQILRLESD